MFHLRRLIKLPISLKRHASTSSTLEHLSERSLIRVSGPEVSPYLQGLITNDMQHLSTGPGSMYAMFLNMQGRILYDVIVYRPPEDNVYLIECDREISATLQKHLKIYRVRRKIDVIGLEKDYNVYALFNTKDIKTKSQDRSTSLDDFLVPCQKSNVFLPSITHKTHGDLLIYRDPRIIQLGSRIIAKSDVNVSNQIKDLNLTIDNDKERNYRWLRYSLGVGEGIHDLPPDNSFPLECNCDFLHGVSFHKGCYVGQELTARVHHTGVIRKRLMPIFFDKIPTQLPESSIIHNKVNLGKFRGIENDVGLGLLRITKALAFKEFGVGDGIGSTCKPDWWPVESSKEITQTVQ